jgi:hypothetical protein
MLLAMHYPRWLKASFRINQATSAFTLTSEFRCGVARLRYRRALSGRNLPHKSPAGRDSHDKGSPQPAAPPTPLASLGAAMQERVSDFVISFALFVVAAFWVWKHMKTGATTRATVHCRAPKGLARVACPSRYF